MPRSFCGCRAFTVSRNLSHSYLERKTPAQCLSIAAQPVRGLLEMAIRSQQNMYLQFLAQTHYTHVCCNLKRSLKYLDLYYFLQRATNTVQKH